MHTKKKLPRRRFLTAAGACVTLPWLECVDATKAFASSAPELAPRRMIAIMSDLGMIPEYFFPKATGEKFELSPYLSQLKDHQNDFTVFSGLSHPEVNGGHQTDQCFLTGALHPRKPGFKNSISLDQYAAQRLGSSTRFPTLTLRVGPSNKTLSYSGDGVALPSENRPSQIFRRLFLQGTKAEIQTQIQRLRDGRSLMDQFAGQLGKLSKEASHTDRQRLDQYLSSIRDVEQRLLASEEWENKPKPSVKMKLPKDNLNANALIERTRAIFQLAKLAIETDSTRLITIFVTQQFNPKVDLPGVEIPHHALTHQMTLKSSREQLEIVERAQMRELNTLLSGLKGVNESGSSLLDQTMVLYGSNLGNAAKHATTNLPVLLAGGGFKHGSHLGFDKEKNMPLANLYVSMLQRLGVESDKFATSTGTLTGLEEK